MGLVKSNGCIGGHPKKIPVFARRLVPRVVRIQESYAGWVLSRNQAVDTTLPDFLQGKLLVPPCHCRLAIANCRFVSLRFFISVTVLDLENALLLLANAEERVLSAEKQLTGRNRRR